MKPRAWSHSAIECHDNCPWQYHEKYISKSVVEEKSAEQDWGTFVHKHFEDYLSTKGQGADQWDPLASGHELPPDMRIHKPYLDGLKAKGGMLYTERKVALRRGPPFGPCSYFDKDTWWRGVIDVTVLEQEMNRATIVDYKTGKKHEKWDQLAMSTVYTFLENPGINLVNAQFYWTSDPENPSRKVWSRSEIDALVALFAPKLQAYLTSFKTDQWPKKQSGLCKGWCPVTACPFWEQKKERRNRS